MSASRLQHIIRAPDNKHDRISCFDFCSRGLSNLAPVDEQNSFDAPEDGVAERQLRCPRFPGNGGRKPIFDAEGILPQHRHDSFTYVVDSESVFMHYDVAWSRRTISINAQHVTAIADIAMPALRRTCLDGKPRVDRGQ